MNWKKAFLKPLIYSAVFFIFFLLRNSLNRHWHFGSLNSVQDILLKSVAIGLGVAGIIEINRDTQRRSYRIMGILFYTGIAVYFVLSALSSYLKLNLIDRVVEYLGYVLWAPFVAIYPLTIFLNRRRDQSVSQPAATNESE